MNILYKKIHDICDEKGITDGKLCAAIGIRRSVLTDLKMGRKQTLSTETLSKISVYFGVSIDYLLGKENQKEKPTVEDGRLDKMESLINKMENGQENRSVTFMGLGGSKKRFDLSQEQFDALERLVEEMTKK